MANAKITALSSMTAPALVDVLPIVDDPSGTPVTKKITYGTLIREGEPFFNVMLYGATGDGVTDDTAEVQAAMDAASAADGGTVLFPPGTYLCGQLTVPSYITLQGVARPHFSEAGDALQSRIKLKNSTNDSLLFIERLAVGITIRDLAIDGNKANNSGTSHGIEFESASPLVPLTTSADADDILDTTIAHGFTAGERFEFVSLTGGANVVVGTVYYVIAANLAAQTLQFSTTLGGAAVDFGSNITAGSISNIDQTNHSSRCTVDRCYVYDCETNGIDIGVGQIATMVNDTWIDSCGQDGIYVGASDCAINDCQIGQSGRYGIWISTSFTKVSGGEIFLSGESNINIGPTPTGSYGTPSTNSIIGVVIQKAVEDGLRIEAGVTGTNIVGCIFEGNSYGDTGAITDPEYQVYSHIDTRSTAQNSVVGCSFLDNSTATRPHAKYLVNTNGTGLIHWAGFNGTGAGSAYLTAQADTLGQLRTPMGGTTYSGADGNIYFPATQVASSDANALDDYEEGTWTPAVTFGGGSTGMTLSTASGRYTKVGRLVTAHAALVFTAKGSSTGTALVSLPFTVANNEAARGGSAVGLYTGMVGSTALTMFPTANAATAQFRPAAATSNSAGTDANFSDTSSLRLTLVYEV
jgi:hypothetical protein